MGMFRNSVTHLLLAGLTVSGCAEPRSEVSLEFDGQPWAQCQSAEVDDLHDGQQPGGFKLSCKSPSWSLYAIYDTRDLKDQRLKTLEFRPPADLSPDLAKQLNNPALGQMLTLKTAVYSTVLGKLDCASAKALNRTAGEEPIPRRAGGALQPGDYSIALAQPCGELKLKVKS